MLNLRTINQLSKIDERKLIDRFPTLDLSLYKDICIVGYNTPIENVTIIEPCKYEFFNNCVYINKFCHSNNNTCFKLIEDNDCSRGIISDGEPNSVTVDDVGLFDLIIVYAYDNQFNCIKGAINNIKHKSTIAYTIYNRFNAEIYKYLYKYYSNSFLAVHNDNVVVVFDEK